MLFGLRKWLERSSLTDLCVVMMGTFPENQMAHWKNPCLITGQEKAGVDDCYKAADLALSFAEDNGLDMQATAEAHKAVLACSAIRTQRIIYPSVPEEPIRIRYLAKYHYIDFVLG